jgi:hypothetical protein
VKARLARPRLRLRRSEEFPRAFARFAQTPSVADPRAGWAAPRLLLAGVLVMRLRLVPSELASPNQRAGWMSRESSSPELRSWMSFFSPLLGSGWRQSSSPDKKILLRNVSLPYRVNTSFGYGCC